MAAQGENAIAAGLAREGLCVIEVVTGLQKVAVLQAQRSPMTLEVSLPDRPLQQPTEAQAADFARAATSVREVSAVPALPDSGLTLRDYLESWTSRLKLADPRDEPLATRLPAQDGHLFNIEELVRPMNDAYRFAINASLLSRGSTETTKVLNTLLKGQ